MKIGELAKSAKCQVETVRYYEKIALLALPRRTEGNYRIYEQKHRERLHFIRHCRALGMKLEEIRTLVHLSDHPESGCGVVNELIETQLERIAEQIAALQQLKNRLCCLRQSCSIEGPARECGILHDLSECAADFSCGSNS